jgi:nucleoside-diphosphate-sugar epimerase
VLSPRRVVEALIHAMELPSEALGMTRSLTLPGRTFTVAEMVGSLRRVAGPAVVDRIRWEPDPLIRQIVAGWPQRFHTPRAERLGFAADASLDEIVRQHIEDELGGRFAT